MPVYHVHVAKTTFAPFFIAEIGRLGDKIESISFVK